ncbi:MAG: glycosyltransferase family A protein [Verrucomicrobiia bacterium]|jgi:glycosyltransferase involved in cell wall biosynthesis
MLVSAIIPTYNRARTIERAVNSVLGQSWQPIEVIVVDDGSTDQTTDILARYGDRIRLIRQKNQGPSAARNAGIKAARGEIVTFLDSDDSWLPDKVERQAKLLQATESQGVACCVCNARMEFLSGTRYSFAAASLHPRHKEGIWSNPAEILVTRFLFFNQVAAIWRTALEETGYFRPGIMEDYDLALRLSLVGPWAFIADPLVVWYEQKGDNLSRTHSPREITERALKILLDIRSSSRWGTLLPDRLLRRRIRELQRQVFAQRLSVEHGWAAKGLAKCLVAYLRIQRRVQLDLRVYPSMVTQKP